MAGSFTWKNEIRTDARGNPEALRIETVSSLMQKLGITEEEAKARIKQATSTEGDLLAQPLRKKF